MKKLLFTLLFFLYPALALSTPTITSISAFYTESSFFFKASCDTQVVNFDPLTVGGWAFQLFLDTDQNDFTGYSGLGFDFNVRGVEQETNGLIHVRRTRGGGPGEWGESTGTVPLMIEDSFFSIVIPLTLLDYDDGNLDYRLELYETVAASTSSGTSNLYMGHYDGRSAPGSVPEPATMLLLCSCIVIILGIRLKIKNSGQPKGKGIADLSS